MCWKYCALMYGNGKMRRVESILGMRGVENKGE
jgi:hypothetical protein